MTKGFTYHSVILFTMHFTFTVYVIGDRTKLTRYAIAKFPQTKSIGSAWTSFCNVRGFDAQQRIRFIQLTETLSNSMCDVFNSANSHYTILFGSNFLLSIMTTSFTILFAVIDIYYARVILLILRTIQLTVIPLGVCAFVSNSSTQWIP